MLKPRPIRAMPIIDGQQLTCGDDVPKQKMLKSGTFFYFVPFLVVEGSRKEERTRRSE